MQHESLGDDTKGFKNQNSYISIIKDGKSLKIDENVK